ncbi:hypothetical protein LCGC14_2111640 [marine sediment metagenome]|uniref:Uncharacterized protein n=1 Tax=marine sediment metagenome TaxID=412755 RepID=A0A0F9H397_9ZZZZ
MLQLCGRYELELVRNGKVIHQAKGQNLVTTLGENYAANRFGTTGLPTAIDWIALGDGTTAAAKSDTDLGGTEHNRTASTSDTTTGNSITFVFAITAGGSITVSEAGLFNNAAAGPASGTMVARFLTQQFNMGVGDVLNVTWQLEFTGVE